ncbi:MAG TPA: hypothetical protein VMV02_08695 [Acidimicrobiales bacterium]|nr:hypothetical protein [Acidimicrobiales bacterium]
MAENLPWDTVIAVNPVSGDLFLGNGFNAVVSSSDIVRVHDPGPGVRPVDCTSVTKSGTSAPGCSVYAAPGALDGLAFAPDGTLYARGSGTSGDASDLWSITGTGSAHPGVATLLSTAIPGGGVAIVSVPGTGGTAVVLHDSTSNELVALPAGTAPAAATVLVTGPLAPVALGPDGCLYLDDQGSLYRLGSSGGGCGFGFGAVSSRSSLAASLVTPADAFGSVAHEAAVVAVAAGATLLIVFPSQLFNTTFSENDERIRRGLLRRAPWLARLKRALGRARSRATTAGAGGPAGGGPRLRPWVPVALVIAAGSLLGSLLDPASG